MLSVDIDDLDLHKVPCVGEATGAEVGAQRSTHRVTSNLEIGQQKTQSTIATDSSNLSLSSEIQHRTNKRNTKICAEVGGGAGAWGASE